MAIQSGTFQNKGDPYGGSSGGSASPRNYTDTQTSGTTTTQGPQTSTTNQSQTGGSSTTTSSNERWWENESFSKLTTDNTVRKVTQKNMDDEAYGLLMKFLREQAMGGSEIDQQRRQEIWKEIAANQAQRQGYSKGAAVADSAAAASAQMAQALESMLPAITAGVDSAGTSGSAMAALLSNKAAESVSRNAAQLQLEAAISYGQIANQSSSIIAELLKIDDKAADRFLQGLDIAKGARTETTDTTNRTIKESGSSSKTGGKSGSSTSNTSSWSNTSTTQNIGPRTDTQSGSSTTNRQYDPLPPIVSGSGQSWQTPSSYRQGAGR